MYLNIKTRPVVFSLLEITKAQREADLIKCRLPLTVPLSPKLLKMKAGQEVCVLRKDFFHVNGKRKQPVKTKQGQGLQENLLKKANKLLNRCEKRKHLFLLEGCVC